MLSTLRATGAWPSKKLVISMLNTYVLGSSSLHTQRTALIWIGKKRWRKRAGDGTIESWLIRNTWRYAMYFQAVKIWRREFRDGEIQNLRRKQKVSEMQKPKLHTTQNWYSLHWTTKLKQRKPLKANTLLSVTEIGGRIAIKHSKEFPRILNSLRSLHKVDLWLL